MTLPVFDTDNNEKIASILKYANDVMHNQISKGEIIVVAKHSRKDPRKFEIVADSEYDRELEGVELIFSNPEDFKRIFPDLAKPLPTVLAPGMELRATGTGTGGGDYVVAPIHSDPYQIRDVMSDPKSDNPEMYGPQNVMDDDDNTYWAINKSPATLAIDLGTDSEIGTIWIRWNQGHTRQFRFTIAVATEEQIKTKQEDGTTSFAIIPHLEDKYSSGASNQLEPYNLTKDPEILVRARYIMIRVYGNTLNGDWAAIDHVKVTRAVSIKSRETASIIERATPTPTVDKTSRQPLKTKPPAAQQQQQQDIVTPPDKHI